MRRVNFLVRSASAAAVVLLGAGALPEAAVAAGAAASAPAPSPAQHSSAGLQSSGDALATPIGVDRALFTRAWQSARAKGMAGARAAQASASYPLPPGSAPPGCSTVSSPPTAFLPNAALWPNITGSSGTKCYLDGYQGTGNSGSPFSFMSTGADQQLFAGQAVTVGTICTDPTPAHCGNDINNHPLATGAPAPAAWTLKWTNLFDPQPLMRSDSGQPANDTSGYDSFFLISPQLDNGACLNTPAGFVNGRWVMSCKIAMSKGPYYGTPGGQTLPWTVFAGATGYYAQNVNDPQVVNCGGTCGPQWMGINIETPVFIQPSPYAAFSSHQTSASTVAFTDQTLSDIPISAWQWDFGDGTTGSGQTPTHTYTQGGLYTVTLKVVTNDGQSSTAQSAPIDIIGALTVSSPANPAPIAVGATLDVPVTITNNNATDDPITGVTLGAPTLPADGAVTLTSGPTPAGPFDITAGSSQTVDYIFTGQAVSQVGDAVGFTASGTDPAANTVSGSSSTKVRVREATVTSVSPAKGQVDGGTVLTVSGTGFTDASGTGLVNSVTFTPQAGGSALTGTNVAVTNDTTLSVTTPSAAGVMAQDATMVTDVQAVTSSQTSPVAAGDAFTYGCQAYVNQQDGPWLFGGCFNKPDTTDFTGSGQDTLDGLTVTSPTGTVADFSNGGGGGDSVTSTGPVTVGLNLGKSGAPTLLNSAINASLAGGPITLSVPAGTVIAGLPISGTATLTPSAGGTVTGVVTATLPPILGGKTGTITFVSTQAAGVTSVTVSAPGGGNLGQLFGLTISSFKLDLKTSTWSVAGTALTSAGASTPFTASLTYTGGALTGGKLTVGKVSVAGILDVTKLQLIYNKGWSGSATLTQGAQSAAVAFGFSGGQLVSGAITTGPITLFNALPLKSLALTYNAGAWSLSTTADVTGTGTLGASLAVNASGQITGGQIQLTGGTIALFSKLTITDLLLSYSTPGGVPTYTGTLGVQLPPPATVVTGVKATLTVANGAFKAAALEVTGNVPLGDGLFLHQVGASVNAPAPPKGAEICGSVGLTGGPTVNGSALIGINGAIDYTFGAVGGYKIGAELTVPKFVIDGGVLGNMAMTMATGQTHALFQIALGTGTAAGHCPLAALGPSKGIKLGNGVEITGTLSGDVNASDFLINGKGTFKYPPLFGTTVVSGAVAIDQTDITACAAKTGSTGSYGFTLLWDGTFTTYSGNCPLTPAFAVLAGGASSLTSARLGVAAAADPRRRVISAWRAI